MTTIAVNRSPSRVTTGVFWALQIISAAVFLMAGVSKLAGAAAMVQVFDTIGIGQWFRYLTGGIEVAGAILLLIPSLASYGAAALAITMVGAIITHLFIIGGNPAVPILLLASTTTIAWTKRGGR
jgi:putative oxidoreductase